MPRCQTLQDVPEKVDGTTIKNSKGILGLKNDFITINDVKVKLGESISLESSVNVKDFGATGDGVTDDSTAIQAALNSNNSVIMIPKGHYIISSTIVIPKGKAIIGEGNDYWDTFTPSEDRPTEPLVKRDAEGTHLVFKGTGSKAYSAINLPNNTPSKTLNSDTYGLTHFTNQGSVAGAPATAKSFSVGIILQENSRIKDLRIVPRFLENGSLIGGYNNKTTSSLSDEWDVGIWCDGAYEGVVENVQAVGYWRIAGILITENNGTYEQWGNNPERLRITNTVTQGIRGLLIRNSPQWSVSSNTSTTITSEWNNTWTLTSQDKFKIVGSSNFYTFTGYTFANNEVTLTGVSPNLPSNVTGIRSPSIGNNFAGTVLENCVFNSFEHSSEVSSDTLGLPIAGALEMNGYPLRGIKFVNSKCQTIYDKLNSLFGDCRDTKFVSCQFENGAQIAYDVGDSSISYTENLRMVNSYNSSGTLNRTMFTPRGYYNDYDIFPTAFDPAPFKFDIQPPLNSSLGYSDEVKLQLLSSDGYERYVHGDNGSDSTLRTGQNLELAYQNGSTSETILKCFGASKNMEANGNISPAVDDSKSLGTTSKRWSEGWFEYIYLTSPNGTRWRLSVDNAGNLNTTAQ